MSVEVAYEVLRVGDVDAVLPPGFGQPGEEYSLSRTLQPAQHHGNFAGPVRLLEHARDPVEQIFGMRRVPGANHTLDVLAHQRPVALRWFDRVAGPQIPAALGRGPGRIKYDAA